jgi:hypothetical protein
MLEKIKSLLGIQKKTALPDSKWDELLLKSIFVLSEGFELQSRSEQRKELAKKRLLYYEYQAALAKRQFLLTSDQKKYARTIRNATWIMTIATAIVALATIVQICIITTKDHETKSHKSEWRVTRHHWRY